MHFIYNFTESRLLTLLSRLPHYPWWFYTQWLAHSNMCRKPNETMRLLVTTFIGVVFGFFLGVSFPTLSLSKVDNSTFKPQFDARCSPLFSISVSKRWLFLRYFGLYIAVESPFKSFSFNWSHIHWGQILGPFNPSAVECLVLSTRKRWQCNWDEWVQWIKGIALYICSL